MKKFNLKGVSIQTWARTIVLLIALVSQILVVFGKSDTAADVDTLQEKATMILTLIASVWSWWKNNSFTYKAQQGDKLMNGEIVIPCGENEASTIIEE